MATDVIEVVRGPVPVIEVVTGAPGPVGPAGPQGEPGPPAPSSSVFFYRVDANSTAAGDPGAGKVRWNAAPQSAATELYVDWLTADGFDAHLYFKTTPPASHILIQDADAAETYQEWKRIGVVESAGWFTVQVELVSQSGPGGVAAFPHNAQIAVIIQTAGEPGPPGPAGADASGDVVGPASATDNAIAVFSGTTGKLVKDALGAAALGRINALAIGSSPAQSGAVRLSEADASIKFRYLSADFFLARYQTGGGGVRLGNESFTTAIESNGPIEAVKQLNVPSVAIGTNPAQTGEIRLPNLGGVQARNAANDGDVQALQVDAANNVVVGRLSNPSSGRTYVDGPSGVVIRAQAASYDADNLGIYPEQDAQRRLGYPTLRFTEANLSASVNIGTNPAQSGALRLANGAAAGVSARNAAGSADSNLIYLSSGNDVVIGAAGGRIYTPCAFLLQERTAPSAPAADFAHLWLQDNGAGKSQLMIQFATGAPIAIATQA